MGLWPTFFGPPCSLFEGHQPREVAVRQTTAAFVLDRSWRELISKDRKTYTLQLETVSPVLASLAVFVGVIRLRTAFSRCPSITRRVRREKKFAENSIPPARRRQRSTEPATDYRLLLADVTADFSLYTSTDRCDCVLEPVA